MRAFPWRVKTGRTCVARDEFDRLHPAWCQTFAGDRLRSTALVCCACLGSITTRIQGTAAAVSPS